MNFAIYIYISGGTQLEARRKFDLQLSLTDTVTGKETSINIQVSKECDFPLRITMHGRVYLEDTNYNL